MTNHELEQLEKDARRPNRGAKYYPPSVVLALIEELRKVNGGTASPRQEGLFSTDASGAAADEIEEGE